MLIGLALLCVGCEKEQTSQRDVVLEVAASMEDLFDTPTTRAKRLYGQYCSVCHGINGQGDGFNAYNLTPRPRNFTDSTFIARMDTTLIREAIVGGGSAVGLTPLMPKWGRTLTERDIRELTRYIVELGKQNAQ
jgi:mono/diheme cytochrome c family protein